MSARHSRTDANQTKIVAALRKAGATVVFLSDVGGGCPDLLVGYAGANWLLEVKTSDASPLTPAQQEFRATWRGNCHIVWDPEQALRVIGAVKSAPPQVEAGMTIKEAWDVIRTSNDSWNDRHQMAVEQVLRSYCDKNLRLTSAAAKAINELILHYTGERMVKPVGHLCNYLAKATSPRLDSGRGRDEL